MDGDFSFTPTKGMNQFIFQCQKGERECKYWLKRNEFDIDEVYSYNLSVSDKIEVKKIIFKYFESY